MEEFQQLITNYVAWAEREFGPVPPGNVIRHLRREVEELAEAPTDQEEYADVLLMTYTAAHKAGYNVEAMFTAMLAKFEKNKLRLWCGYCNHKKASHKSGTLGTVCTGSPHCNCTEFREK